MRNFIRGYEEEHQAVDAHSDSYRQSAGGASEGQRLSGRSVLLE